MTLTTRRIGVSDPRHVPQCDRCRDGERHDFAVHFIPTDGHSWDRTIHAIGPFEARFLAEQHAATEEPGYTSIFIRHASSSEEVVLDVLSRPTTPEDVDPADPDAAGHDPVDEWRAYRDAGYTERELRALSGDR